MEMTTRSPIFYYNPTDRAIDLRGSSIGDIGSHQARAAYRSTHAAALGVA